MINLEIRIGSRPYQITCREGQQPHYEALTKIINEKIATAESALGSMSETRLLMFATLLLADEINDIRAGNPVSAASGVDPPALERVAERIEALATALEARA